LKIRISNPRQRGIALPIVMMVLILLSAVVGGFAYAMKVEMRLAQNDNHDADLEWIGRGGVEWARFAITQKCPGQANIDALNQSWAGGTGCTNDPLTAAGADLKNIPFGPDGVAQITIVDMERKWNINALANPRSPQPIIFQQAFNAMGVTDPGLISSVTDSILDWVDPDDQHRFNGAEADYYMHQNPPCYCKNGFIDDLSELLLIKGIEPEMYSPNNTIAAYQMRANHGMGLNHAPPVYTVHLEDLFTTMGRGRINVNTASATVLQLIPGVDPEAAANIIRTRAGQDGMDGTEDDVPFMNVGQINGMNVPSMAVGPAASGLTQFCDVRSYYFEVTVVAKIGASQRTYHAIIQRQPSRPNDPQIVRFYWE
jgi:type II secretory pathway component PulK